MSYKISCFKFDAFTRRNGSFYPKKTRLCAAKVLEAERGLLKTLKYLVKEIGSLEGLWKMLSLKALTRYWLFLCV